MRHLITFLFFTFFSLNFSFSQTIEELLEKPNFIEYIQKAGEFNNFAKLSTLIMEQKENSLNNSKNYYKNKFKELNIHPEKSIHFENFNNAFKKNENYANLLYQANDRVSLAKIVYDNCKKNSYNTYNNCNKELEYYKNWVNEANSTDKKVKHWYYKIEEYRTIYNEYVNDYNKGLKEAKNKDLNSPHNATINYSPEIRNLIKTLDKAYEKIKLEQEK